MGSNKQEKCKKETNKRNLTKNSIETTKQKIKHRTAAKALNHNHALPSHYSVSFALTLHMFALKRVQQNRQENRAQRNASLCGKFLQVICALGRQKRMQIGCSKKKASLVHTAIYTCSTHRPCAIEYIILKKREKKNKNPSKVQMRCACTAMPPPRHSFFPSVFRVDGTSSLMICKHESRKFSMNIAQRPLAGCVAICIADSYTLHVHVPSAPILWLKCFIVFGYCDCNCRATQ